METAKAKLTVLFDPPFWVGIFERESGGRYEACRVIFALPAAGGPERTVSPKRAQRLARRETQASGMGTRAQQALQLQREQAGRERRALSREERAAEQERRYRLHQQKRRARHRGR